MTSRVEICNKALTLLSSNLIMAFDPDESIEAALCVTNYDSARRYTLEQRGWTFATTRKVLSTPETGGPEWGYSQRHQKPTNPQCLRLLVVSDDPSYKDGGSRMDWRLEGNYIVTEFSTIYVKYVYDEIQEDRFSPSFVEAMAHWLAYLMCMSLTESRTLKDSLKADFNTLISEASGADGTQGSSDRIRSPRLLDVRRLRGRNLGRQP